MIPIVPTIQPNDHATTHASDEKTVGIIDENTQIASPHAVNVPLPPAPQEQIAVPASINGRDLSRGKP